MTSIVSTVPLVIERLVSYLANVLPNVQVCDGGPVPPEDTASEIICIAYTGTDGEPSVENTRSIQQMTSQPDREAYDIVCLASSWQGDQTSSKRVRDLAYGLVNSVAEELGKDSTLGGLVMQSRVGSDSFAQVQTVKGAVATVRFNIHIEAFTRRT